MPRTRRRAPGGPAYHAMKRACARAELFRHAGDYAAFERVIEYAPGQAPTRLLSYCLMPNHWHLVPWPKEDGELTAFLRRLTHTHARRWHAARQTAGTVHLYQGRFRSFPTQQDGHLLRVIRYVAQPPAGQPRTAGGAVALGQPVAARARLAPGIASPERLAGAAPGGLAGVGERGGDGGGTGGAAAQPQPRLPLRAGAVAAADGGGTGAGADAATARPPAQAETAESTKTLRSD